MSRLSQEEKEFRSHLADLAISRIRVYAALAAFLVPLFGLLDFFAHPNLAADFMVVRSVVSSIALCVLGVTYSTGARSWWFALSIVVCAAVTAGIESMIVRLGASDTPYYAGLSLVLLGSGLVLPWNFRQMCSISVGVVVTYVASALVVEEDIEWAVFLNNVFFLSSTGIIASTASYFSSKLRRSEFFARKELVHKMEALESAYGHQKEFLRTVSHELRTPLHSILGFTELVAEREKSISDRGREHLERVQASGRRLLRLINDILDLSRMEAGRLEIVPQAMEVAPVLQDVAEHARQLIGQRLIQVRVEVDPELRLISDASRVEQILVNLASNAVKFTELGYIRLAARRKPEGVLFAVEDTGIGIPEEEQQGIFEAFRQVRGGGRVEGTGLGLSIVVKLVELMGGGIEMKSQRGEGTTFEVTLPDLQPARHPSGELVVPSMAPDKLRQEPRP